MAELEDYVEYFAPLGATVSNEGGYMFADTPTASVAIGDNERDTWDAWHDCTTTVPELVECLHKGVWVAGSAAGVYEFQCRDKGGLPRCPEDYLEQKGWVSLNTPSPSLKKGKNDLIIIRNVVNERDYFAVARALLHAMGVSAFSEAYGKIGLLGAGEQARLVVGTREAIHAALDDLPDYPITPLEGYETVPRDELLGLSVGSLHEVKTLDFGRSNIYAIYNGGRFELAVKNDKPW